MCHFRRAKQGKKISNQNQDICLDEDSISSTMTSSTLGYRQIICIQYSRIQVDPIYPVLQNTGRLFKSITLGYRQIIYIQFFRIQVDYISQYSRIQVDYISSTLRYRQIIYLVLQDTDASYTSNTLGYRKIKYPVLQDTNVDL